MGRKPRPKVPCSVAGCDRLIHRRDLCLRHYRELALPRCRIRGCPRAATRKGLCDPHRKNGGRPVHSRPKRISSGEPRVLAWGRVHIVRSAIPVIEAEARRLERRPSALIADIVEAWAASKQGGHSQLRVAERCRGPDCDRPAGTSGLCRTHQLQAGRGQPLRPIRPKKQGVRMGSLRLPRSSAVALRRAARTSGLPVAEVLRQRIYAALQDVSALATPPPTSTGRTVRLGALPMPVALAQRLNVLAPGLGVAVAEVVRRAVSLSLPG